MGKIKRYLTITKHAKTQVICLFFLEYCAIITFETLLFRHNPYHTPNLTDQECFISLNQPFTHWNSYISTASTDIQIHLYKLFEYLLDRKRYEEYMGMRCTCIIGEKLYLLENNFFEYALGRKIRNKRACIYTYNAGWMQQVMDKYFYCYAYRL